MGGAGEPSHMSYYDHRTAPTIVKASTLRSRGVVSFHIACILVRRKAMAGQIESSKGGAAEVGKRNRSGYAWACLPLASL